MHICSFYEFCSACWFAFWRWTCMMKKSWKRVSYLFLFFSHTNGILQASKYSSIFIHTEKKTLYWNTPSDGPPFQVFINDLEFNSLDMQEKSKFPPASGLQWPDVEDIRKLPFDLYARDHKFRYASPVYTDRMPKSLNGIKLLFLLRCAFKADWKYCTCMLMCCFASARETQGLK